MSRNSSGTYTLPSGNPVVSGTLIEASWANTTLSDLASSMTDSLSRTAQGGMQAALRLYDGTVSVPGLAWGSETTSGWYRAGAGDMRLVITGTQIMRYQATGVAITGTLSASGNTTVGGTLGVTGATTLSSTLDVTGNATVGGTLAITGAVTLTANPTLSAGTANGVAYLNGSKVLTTGSALTFDGANLNVSGKYGVIGNGNTPTSTALEIGTNGAGSRWLYNVPTGGEHNFTVNGSVASWVNATSSGWLISGSEQMRLTSTGLGIKKSNPAYPLDVVGYGRLSGGLIGSNGLTMYGDSSSATGALLDSSGNLGLGVTPSAWYSGTNARAIQIPSGALSSDNANDLFLTQNAYLNSGATAWVRTNTGYATQYLQTAGQHQWYNAGSNTGGTNITFTQAMTLDASSNLFIGTTTGTAKLNVGGNCAAYGYATRTGTSGSYPGNLFNINWTSSASLWIDTTNVGTITLTSDYRIKKNVATQTAPAIERVMQLRPVTYEITDYGTMFKADGVAREGFIAHEVQAVIPSGADGVKDAEDQIQSLRIDAIVSVLTKAIQEQQAIINQLTDRITALEGA